MREPEILVCGREKEVHFRARVAHILTKRDLGKFISNIEAAPSISSPGSPKGQGEGSGRKYVGGRELEKSLDDLRSKNLRSRLFSEDSSITDPSLTVLLALWLSLLQVLCWAQGAAI